MNIFNLLRIAWRALLRNKLRAFLTMLGIIIGVGAVISMVAIGEGSKKNKTNFPFLPFMIIRTKMGEVL